MNNNDSDDDEEHENLYAGGEKSYVTDISYKNERERERD